MHTNWAQNGLSTQTLNDNDVDEEEPEEEEEEAPTTIENVVASVAALAVAATAEAFVVFIRTKRGAALLSIFSFI